MKIWTLVLILIVSLCGFGINAAANTNDSCKRILHGDDVVFLNSHLPANTSAEDRDRTGCNKCRFQQPDEPEGMVIPAPFADPPATGSSGARTVFSFPALPSVPMHAPELTTNTHHRLKCFKHSHYPILIYGCLLIPPLINRTINSGIINMRKIILVGVAVLLTAAALTAYHIRKDKHNHNGSCETRHSHDEHDHNAHENERKHESHDDHPTSKEHDGHDHDAPSADSTLHLTLEQRNLIGLKIAEAAPGQLETRLQLDGEIRYNLEKMAKVMPRLPGFVSRINAIEGQQVRKGEILAVLQSWKTRRNLFGLSTPTKSLKKLNLAEFQNCRKTARKKTPWPKLDYLKAKRQYADAQIARRRARSQPDRTRPGSESHPSMGCRLEPDNARIHLHRIRNDGPP